MVTPASNFSEIRADSPTTNDLLGFKRLVGPIVRRVTEATDQTTPLTIGVYGEWGSGKTSFLKMVDEELRGRDIYPIWFNAWKYDQEDNLWSALIQTILEQVRVRGGIGRRVWVRFRIWMDSMDWRSGTFEIVKRVVPVVIRVLLLVLSLLIIFGWSPMETERILNRVIPDWLVVGPFTLSTNQARIIKAALSLVAFLAAKPEELFKIIFSSKLGIDFNKFKRSMSYRAHIAFLDEFSEEFKRIIKLVGHGKPIVVIIDDVDRCLPEKAIQVLEAIKLFLDVEGCIFLLAVDREVVEKAIAVKYKDVLALEEARENNSRALAAFLGENYFEKIVQLPISLPPLSAQQINEFVRELYSDEDVKSCSDIFATGLPRNPRKVKRLLQNFLFLRDLAAEDINGGRMQSSLIAKLVIIQNQFRKLYGEIAETPALLAELEKYYVIRVSGESTDGLTEEAADPIIREKVKAYSVQYPLLHTILLQRVSEDDSFIGKNLESYIFLVEPITDPISMIEPPAPDNTELALGRYLRYVIATTEFLNTYNGLSSSIPLASIASIFVQRTFSKDIKGDRDDRTVTLAQILKKEVRIVILGDPGGGKTTLLAYMAHSLANALAFSGSRFTNSHLELIDNLLPILVSLREYGKLVGELSSTVATPQGFLSYLDSYFSRWNLDLPSEFFNSFLEQGSCILLLDGLDEIIDHAARRFVAESIISLARRYPTARIIVTSRTASYRNAPLSEDFIPYTQTPLQEDDILTSIERWTGLTIEDPDSRERVTATLMKIITTNPELRTLAGNPLLLTVILTILRETRSLPNNRIDLYEQVISILLGQRDEARRILLPLDFRFDINQARHLLSKLALVVHEVSQDGSFDASLAVSAMADELLAEGRPTSETSALASSYLRYFLERTGIVIEIGPHLYSFLHRVFEEYLAAVAVSNRDDVLEFILQRYLDPKWQEVTILVAAIFGRTSRTKASDLIYALRNAQTPESILLSGFCLISVGPQVAPKDLRNDVISALRTILEDSATPAGIQSQARTTMEMLVKIQDSLDGDSSKLG